MGSGSNPSSIKPDLFSTAQQPPETSSSSANDPKPPLRNDEPAAGASYALPTNLPSALKYLDDDQLDRLIAAVLAERQARGGKKVPVSDEPRRKKRIKEDTVPLTQGKLNVVRAAFKAGVKPSRIARQFGISLSDVRKALATDEIKR
jgi:hypothetical protein